MKTTLENTLAGLKTYFFDSVFEAHRNEYPPLMNRAEFEQHLDAYRDGMNMHNGCKFRGPSSRTISSWYKDYLAQKNPDLSDATINPPKRATIKSVNNYLKACGAEFKIWFDNCNDWKISKYRVGHDGTNYDLGRSWHRTPREFLEAYLLGNED